MKSQTIRALYLTKNPKLTIFVSFQYLKTVPHISVLNFFSFFFGAHSLHKVMWFFCRPISTHTHTHRMLEQGFVVFPFTFPSLHFCLHIPKTNRLQTNNSISTGEFLFFLCFMGYGGRGLLFFLCPERTPKSPNFG